MEYTAVRNYPAELKAKTKLRNRARRKFVPMRP